MEEVTVLKTPWKQAYLCKKCKAVYGCDISESIFCCPDCGYQDFELISVIKMFSRTPKKVPWWLRWLISPYEKIFKGYLIRDKHGNSIDLPNKGMGEPIDEGR